MKISSPFASLLVLVSVAVALLVPDGHGEGVIRFPLTRKSADIAGHVDMSALNAQFIHVLNKYWQTFSAFEANTGSAHPLSGKMMSSMRKCDDVSIDLGSTDLCHKMYNAAQSSTAKDEGNISVLSYGEAFQPDSFISFAFKQSSALGAKLVFETTSDSGVLPESMFSVKLSSTSGESKLCIGVTNPNLYVEDTLTYTTVTEEGYWQVNLEVVVASNSASIIITGTMYIVMSDDAAEAYYKDIPGSSSILCDTIGSYTPTLTFGGHGFNVSEETFNLGPESDGSSDCMGGISWTSSVDFWVVGGIFLQNIYTVFNNRNLQHSIPRWGRVYQGQQKDLPADEAWRAKEAAAIALTAGVNASMGIDE
ncbi:aspartic peptidase domain-containing protein [Suillus subaureus]|uniref:Aspartic peptidase domain-containing protein n=1 Tax=Suillus subaureus TaxID=48587 RepID=A0A9P7DX25_9AGAM|nr:aspartic peptidase domain-containing protein [Suillus subaureus]KAG1805345.1 aspartic peptidase domain-containing protein [Suillus subaureus]